MASTAACSGLRWGELIALAVSQVDTSMSWSASTVKAA
jgi:integrase